MYLETSPDFWTHLSLQIEPENRTVQTYQEASAYFHAIAQEFSDKAEAMAEEGIDRREEAGKPDAE